MTDLFKRLLADFSIIEFIVYGLMGYSGLILLMVQILQPNPPTNRSFAGARVVFLSPSLIGIMMLMFASGDITLETENISTNSTILTYNETNDLIFTENVTRTESNAKSFTLIEPIWGLIHLGFLMIIIVYITIQVLNILTKPE